MKIPASQIVDVTGKTVAEFELDALRVLHDQHVVYLSDRGVIGKPITMQGMFKSMLNDLRGVR
jgi:hypothetical protein